MGLEDVWSLLDAWIEWGKKIVQLSQVESKSRPLIRKLVQKLETPEENLDNQHGM